MSNRGTWGQGQVTFIITLYCIYIFWSLIIICKAHFESSTLINPMLIKFLRRLFCGSGANLQDNKNAVL
jgi:hypothetical protein